MSTILYNYTHRFIALIANISYHSFLNLCYKIPGTRPILQENYRQKYVLPVFFILEQATKSGMQPAFLLSAYVLYLSKTREEVYELS